MCKANHNEKQRALHRESNDSYRPDDYFKEMHQERKLNSQNITGHKHKNIGKTE